MDVRKWVEVLKLCKPTVKQTCQFAVKATNPEPTQWRVFKDGVLVLEAKFNAPQNRLTIFEATVLYAFFVLKRKPADYAGFHKCSAGKAFIENIKEIWVGVPKVSIEVERVV